VDEGGNGVGGVMVVAPEMLRRAKGGGGVGLVAAECK
jgi:hypothetical protein